MPMNEKFKQERYIEIINIVKKHRGQLKTKTYTVLYKPMSVACQNGHRFRVTPKNLLRGIWCKKCQPLARQKEFLKLAKELAKDKGGRCLSTEYINARKRLRWQCKSRHQWEATFDNVVNKKSWCPKCSQAEASGRKEEWWKKQKRKHARR